VSTGAVCRDVISRRRDQPGDGRKRSRRPEAGRTGLKPTAPSSCETRRGREAKLRTPEDCQSWGTEQPTIGWLTTGEPANGGMGSGRRKCVATGKPKSEGRKSTAVLDTNEHIEGGEDQGHRVSFP